MTIIICSGIHKPDLTLEFIDGMRRAGAGLTDRAIVPIDYNPPLFPPAFFFYLKRHHSLLTPLTIISFSAGVPGAVAGANLWRASGGKIKALIAFDGWGVPLFGDFPLYRVSHDYFTHYTSLISGGGGINFYAEPAISHLDLWRFPDRSRGWKVTPSGKSYTNAAVFLARLLE